LRPGASLRRSRVDGAEGGSTAIRLPPRPRSDQIESASEAPVAAAASASLTARSAPSRFAPAPPGLAAAVTTLVPPWTKPRALLAPDAVQHALWRFAVVAVLLADRQRQPLHRQTGPRRRVLRATRAIRQTRCALLPPAPPQPITKCRTDTKPPAQLTAVHSLLCKQHHKLMPLRHDRLLQPRHSSLSPAGQECRQNASTMSPNTRPRSPQSVQPRGDPDPVVTVVDRRKIPHAIDLVGRTDPVAADPWSQ
jgi:hypothetical protein